MLISLESGSSEVSQLSATKKDKIEELLVEKPPTPEEEET